jgi:ABC-type transport system involved in multi-copper enzyme maturation permease subunit
MSFLPVVERELRLKSRRSRTYYSRCAMAVVATLMSLGIITVSLSAGRNPTQIGQDLFRASALAAFVFSLLAGITVTADCLSEEKRDGTLGLLFLTDLKGYDVVLGKLVAASLPVFYLLVAAIPVLALPFFLGGVTAGEFWRMAAALLAALFFSLSVGMFVSAISRDSRRAFAAATTMVAALTLAPLLISLRIVSPGTIWTAALAALPGPGLVFLGVDESKYTTMRDGFWRSLFVLLLLSVALLAVASLLLPHAWQDRAVRSRPAASREINAPLRRRQARRKKLLGGNPVVWLAERTRLNTWAAQAFWILIVALWLAGFSALRNRALALPMVFAAVYALHAVVKCWVAWEASRRIAEDKRSGALELLLTTPLGERPVLAGWLIGLKRRFLWPFVTLCALDVHLWWSGESGEWLLAMVAIVGLLLADSYTICWVGLWLGLNARNSTHAFLRTIGQVLMFPWLAFLGVLGIWGVLAHGKNFPPDFPALAIAWFLVSYMLDFGFVAGPFTN